MLVLKNAELVLPLSGMIDQEAEIRPRRQGTRRDRIPGPRLSAMLSNESFVAKAPEQVVAKERAKLEVLEDKLKRLRGG